MSILNLKGCSSSSTPDGARVRDAESPLWETHTKQKRNKRTSVHETGVLSNRKTIFFAISTRIYWVKMPDLAVERVVVHPLVLLSVVDHFNR